MICQEINCKKQQSRKHYGTLCKTHAEKLEKWQKQRGDEYDPFEYKIINEKNNVWENGIEHVRSIPTSHINDSIKRKEKVKQTFLDMQKVINDNIEKIDREIEDLMKTKNSRYVK